MDVRLTRYEEVPHPCFSALLRRARSRGRDEAGERKFLPMRSKQRGMTGISQKALGSIGSMNEAISILVGTSVHDRKGPDPIGPRDLLRHVDHIYGGCSQTQQVEASLLISQRAPLGVFGGALVVCGLHASVRGRR